MSKKVKQEVVKRIEDKQVLTDNYLNSDFTKKIVCCNVFSKFWGMVEVADPVIKRYIDLGGNGSKVEFIAAEQSLMDDNILKKINLSAKPVYVLFYVLLIFNF